MFKYGKGTYTMLLSVADRGETIKDERERKRERNYDDGTRNGRNNQRTLAYVQSDNALLTRIIIIHLENDQRPFNKPTHITQQQPQYVHEVIFCCYI